MENFKWIGWFIAVIMVGVFLFQRSCTPQPPVPEPQPPEIVYIYDTIPQVIIQTNTEIIYDTIIVPEYMPLSPDTLAIISDYFSKVKYRDTLMNDSSALLVLDETVFMNRLFEREIIFLNRRPREVYIKEPVPTPVQIREPQLFVGATLSSGLYGQDINLGFAFADPKRGLFTYHYGLVQKQHTIGYHFKIQNWNLFFRN